MRGEEEAIKGSISPAAAVNWNVLASSLLIASWQRLGVRTYFISPGYRDAPFIAALQAQAEAGVDLELVSCFDERAAAYQALGYAKARGLPAVLVCTSGTAAANYYPAVIEAAVEQVPLLLVTADRPFELVHAAAQQVIDQRQIFGRFAKKSLEFPAPSPALKGRAWIDIARELLHCARLDPAGPVHINLPFELPLDPRALPTEVAPSESLCEELNRELERLLPLIIEEEAASQPAREEALLRDLRGAERGLILLGRLSRESEKAAALRIAQRLGWPCFADVSSGLKGTLAQEIIDLQHPHMRAAYESHRPDVILHLGRRLLSRHFDDAIERHPPAVYWVLSREQGPQDTAHLPQRQQYPLSLRSLAEQLERETFKAARSELLTLSEKLRVGFRELRGDFNFSDVADAVIELSPRQGHGLFLGNSTAIRAFDSWCQRPGPWPRIEANRGVSGIEGLISTTMGLARASREPWTVVLGDISLLHDLNSLFSLAGQSVPLVIVLVNNGGGRIFETLPIAAFPAVKDPWISTPHSFTFAGVAAAARLPYELCEDREAFRAAYAAALARGQSTLIECLQAPDADRRYQSRLRELRS